MSRTFRHIPYYMRGMKPYQKTWIGLAEAGYGTYNLGDYYVRHSLFNGYDDHRGRGFYYDTFAVCGCMQQQYVGKTRKFYKRRYHKRHRQVDVFVIKEYLNE